MSTSTTATGHLTVAEVMRPPVTTVERSAHVAAVAYLMKKSHDNAIVVLADGATCEPVTMVCDSDVTRAVADGRDPEQARITELPLPPLVLLAPEDGVTEAAERMLAADVVFAPVVAGGRLVGLVDMPGVCRALLAERRTDRAGVPRP